MSTKEKNQELKQLIENLSIPPEQAKQMLYDIQQGDNLLDKYAQPFIPQPVTDNINRTLQHALAKQKAHRIRTVLYRRIAAAVIIGVLASAAVMYWQNRNSTIITSNNPNKTIATNVTSTNSNTSNNSNKAIATNLTNTVNNGKKTIITNIADTSNSKTKAVAIKLASVSSYKNKAVTKNNNSNKPTSITLDEADILELALIAEQQQSESNIDDMVLTEVLSSWDSSQSQNSSSRKESSYETTNNYFTGLNSHCLYA